jgi:hypothetical protein
VAFISLGTVQTAAQVGVDMRFLIHCVALLDLGRNEHVARLWPGTHVGSDCDRVDRPLGAGGPARCWSSSQRGSAGENQNDIGIDPKDAPASPEWVGCQCGTPGLDRSDSGCHRTDCGTRWCVGQPYAFSALAAR